MPLKNK